MLTHIGGLIKRVNEQIILGDFSPFVVHFMTCPQMCHVPWQVFLGNDSEDTHPAPHGAT